MSGRKSAEVAAVLRQGESVRKMTDGIYSREIENYRRNYLACLDDERTIKSEISAQSINLDATAKEMFGAEADSYISEFNRLKNSAEKISLSDESKVIISELNRLDNELDAADAEGESIRQAIKEKYRGWYCDDEYRRAQNLVSTYSNLRDKRANLERRMKNLLTAENQKLSSLQLSERQIKNLTAQISDMNEVANKRKEADSYREELRHALSSINANDAQKFFPADFDSLKKNINAAISRSDDDVLANFKNSYEQITNFQKNLTERVALWQKQKKDAEEFFANMEHVASAQMIEPVEYYNDGVNGKKISMFDYMKTYAGKDVASKYSQLRDKASNLIRQENFLDSMKVMQTAIEFVENVRKDALQLQESMLKKTELAGAIQDVMSDLRYDTDLEIINDNPNDGFKITCRAGDETIDFTHIDIGDDGKVKIDIDHQEGSGKCSDAWKDIARGLNEIGIPLSGVKTASGYNVLGKTSADKTTSANVQQSRG